MQGRFDRITSVGMFEHVGRRNLPMYFAHMRELLADDGFALNHGITSTDADVGATALAAVRSSTAMCFLMVSCPT